MLVSCTGWESIPSSDLSCDFPDSLDSKRAIVVLEVVQNIRSSSAKFQKAQHLSSNKKSAP
eukprot:6212506-Amphidinium_carterae.1